MVKKYEPAKFKLRLICVNCGMMAMYEIPVRRVFHDFRPEGPQPPVGEYMGQEFSHYEFVNGDGWTPVICAQCSVPMLVRTPLNIIGSPMQFENIPQS